MASVCHRTAVGWPVLRPRLPLPQAWWQKASSGVCRVTASSSPPPLSHFQGTSSRSEPILGQGWALSSLLTPLDCSVLPKPLARARGSSGQLQLGEKMEGVLLLKAGLQSVWFPVTGQSRPHLEGAPLFS